MAWVCEFYIVISVRTRISMFFFPKVMTVQHLVTVAACSLYIL